MNALHLASKTTARRGRSQGRNWKNDKQGSTGDYCKKSLHIRNRQGRRRAAKAVLERVGK